MRRFAFAVASFVLFAGTSALAQVDGESIGFQAGSSYTTPGTACPSAPCTNTSFLPGGEGRFPGTPGATGGAAYNSFVTVGAQSIFFESSNAVSQGPFTSFSSSSTVSFNFVNPEDGPIAFHSEITPQGLGMYLADTSGGCIFTNSCVQVSDELHTFGELSNGDGPELLGGVGFTFDILDNESTIYTLQGQLILARNFGDDCEEYCFIDNLGAFAFEDGEGFHPATGARSLDDFGQQTLDDDFSAKAFGWGATDVNLTLGSGFHSIEYRTSVFSFTNADCVAGGDVCLVAYSGFGDPIGRGGGIAAASLLSGFDVGALDHGGEGGLINGLSFTPAQFRLPRFGPNGLTFDSGAAVPEPGTWALMIMGFGVMGAALRRRRIPAHI